MATGPANYSYFGNPISQGFASQTAQAHLAAQGQIGAANAQAAGNAQAAANNQLGTLYGQPGNMYGAFANAGANAFGAYAGGLGNMGSSAANMYGAYANNLQNLYSNQTAAMGNAEAARQVGLANLGTAGLSSMGQMMGGAFGAQAQNQSAAYKAMADMQAANQGAMGSYGSAREQSLANLGQSAASLGSSGANAYSQLGVGSSTARANAAGSIGSAYGGALGSLANAAGNVGSSANTALGGMYGAIGNAQGQFGAASQAARGNMMSSLANTNLGGYNTGASYQADMAKLGLSRELGLGQIGVAGNAFNSPGGGGVNMTAGGAPLGYASGSYSPQGGAGMGGGGYIPGPQAPREWYQDPQSLASFPDQSRFGAQQMQNADMAVLGGLRNTSREGGRNIGASSASAMQNLQGIAGRTSALPGMLSDTMGGINRDYANSSSGIGQSMGQGFGSIADSRNAITSSPVAGLMARDARAGRRQLSGSMASNDRLLSDFLNRGMGSMQSTLADAYGQVNTGMDQFYGNIPRDGASLLGSAYNNARADLRGFGNQMGTAFRDFNAGSQRELGASRNQLGDIMDRTGYYTPIGRAQADAAASDFNNQRRQASLAEDRARSKAFLEREIAAGRHIPYATRR